MFTEQAVVHAPQSSLSLNITNTTQLPNPNLRQNQYQQPKQQQNNHNYRHKHHPHSPHHLTATQQNAQHHHYQEQDLQYYHNHNYHRQNKKVHTLPSSLPTSMESSISQQNSIIEHCSCGLTFKVDKNTNVNVITSSTSLLTLNTIYNENPTLIDQTNNQDHLTQSQNILQDTQHHLHYQHNQYMNKYNHHHQHHAPHCHHHQTPISIATMEPTPAAVTISRYQPTEPPEIHTHEYFSQESQTLDHTTTITNTNSPSTSAAPPPPPPAAANAFTPPHTHGCRHSHVHAQTDFSYGQR